MIYFTSKRMRRKQQVRRTDNSKSEMKQNNQDMIIPLIIYWKIYLKYYVHITIYSLLHILYLFVVGWIVGTEIFYMSKRITNIRNDDNYLSTHILCHTAVINLINTCIPISINNNLLLIYTGYLYINLFIIYHFFRTREVPILNFS